MMFGGSACFAWVVHAVEDWINGHLEGYSLQESISNVDSVNTLKSTGMKIEPERVPSCKDGAHH